MASVIEQELLKASKFRQPKDGYEDRQDYLGALARACYKLQDDDFDDLTDEAANWVNEGVKSLNKKEELLDFPDAEGAEDAADSPSDRDVVEHNGIGGGKDIPKQPIVQPVAPSPSPSPRPRARKFKPRQEEMDTIQTRYDNLTGEKDRFGILIGTKTQEAVVMYERGTTSVELRDKLGGRFYNILGKLQKDGHHVERSPEGIFTVTHKDDYPAKQAAEKAAKAKKGKK